MICLQVMLCHSWRVDNKYYHWHCPWPCSSIHMNWVWWCVGWVSCLTWTWPQIHWVSHVLLGHSNRLVQAPWLQISLRVSNTQSHNGLEMACLAFGHFEIIEIKRTPILVATFYVLWWCLQLNLIHQYLQVRLKYIGNPSWNRWVFCPIGTFYYRLVIKGINISTKDLV